MGTFEMSLFFNIKKYFNQAAEHRARSHAREQMLRMSDRQLADFGISRILLLEGNTAWPWHDVEKSTGGLNLSAVVSARQEKPLNKNSNTHSPSELRKAIRELNTYSDRELSEMGITRASIREVVRSGRNSVEGVAEKHKRAA